MFSFHKPKVYRSATGCCICKAKSSSSRFTDSKRYEDEFIKCFQLEEHRSGEICNACVLLVKRWKKLPVGSSRNWRHVVDARAGPGIKSLTKFKSKNKKKPKDCLDKFDKVMKKKHFYAKNGDREHSPAMSDDMTDDYHNGAGSKGSSRAGSPMDSDDIEGEKRLDIDHDDLDVSSFIDLTYFKRKNVCCGVIFVGMMGEVLIEPTYFKPCVNCLARQQRERSIANSLAAIASPLHSSASASPCHSSASTSPAHSVESNVEAIGKAHVAGKGFCDSSSDSGYDDNSQGTHTENKIRASSLQILARSDKMHMPITSKILPISSAVRLNGMNSSSTSGTKVPIKLLCKPMALVSSAKLSLSGNSTPRPIKTLLTVRPPPQRESLAN
ncbi:hypothetical protein QAD02_006850 [Eretmocerus hayati]|uniref:Uncharacterized protein n=1 Tax=Eretmocerus hayati TaxID=131215 RepID=A0ACC2N2G8_9HYME|nr:hypothetical protein QAD02_006850 [Eretmocerus hayati]